MPNYIADKYVKNNVATLKEIQEYELAQKKAKRAALTTTVSIGLVSNILASNVISKFGKEEVKIEQTASPEEKRVETNTLIKGEVIASPEILYDGKQHYSESGKELIATVYKAEESTYKNTMNRIVESEDITKINTVGIENNEFDPFVTYFTDKGAEVYVPAEGKVIEQKDKMVKLEHQKDNTKYYSVINGVETSVKENTVVKQGESLGKVSGGVVKFSVAKTVEDGEASEFIHPNLFVDIDKSDQLNYETGKIEKTKEVAKTTSTPKVTAEIDTKPSVTNKATKTEEKVVKDLPFGETIIAAAEKHDVDPLLIAGLIKQESSFDEKATSKSGAMGLMQLMPETAEWLGVEDAYDPKENVDAGVKFLKKLIDKYNDPELAVYAYNGGPGNIDKWKEEGLTPEEFPWEETREYAPKVLKNFDKLKEKANENEPSAAYKEKIASIPSEYSNPIDFGNVSGKLEGLKIGIDAGHYPAAPGADSYDEKTTELEVNREIKELVISKLEKTGATVIDSNGDTQSLGPGQRAKVFDANDVDFALSLHNNAATNKDASGTETLYEQGVPESQQLAQQIQNNIAKAIPTISDRGTVPRNGDLGIFTKGETVTALVETGFMTNPYDMELLRNKTVKENIGNAIVQGFVDFVESTELVKNEEPAKDKKKEKSSDDKADSEKASKDEPKKESKDNSNKDTKEDPKQDSNNETKKEVDAEKPQETSTNDNGKNETPTEPEKVEEVKENSPTKDESTNTSESTEEKTNQDSNEGKQTEETKEELPKEDETNSVEKSNTEEEPSDDEEHSFIFSKFFE